MGKAEVSEWLLRAEKDFEEAKFLFEHHRPLENAAFFIHQAVEKALKGYLIGNSWELEKTHDLVKLNGDATKFDTAFTKFVPFMEGIVDYYIESRYPIGYLVEYTREEIEKAIIDSRTFMAFVKGKCSK